MANSRKGKTAATSALNHYRREMGGQGDGSSTDAIDLITDLLLSFQEEVAEHILDTVAMHEREDRQEPETD